MLTIKNQTILKITKLLLLFFIIIMLGFIIPIIQDCGRIIGTVARMIQQGVCF